MCRCAAGSLLALVVASAAPAGAGELNLLVTSSANMTETTVGDQSNAQHGFTQTLDMNYNRNVTPLLSYRLRLRGSDNESTTSSGSTSASATNRFLEPQVDATLAGAKYSLNAGVRLRQTFTSGSEAQPQTLTEDQEFLRAFFTPDLLPAFTFQLDRTATVDDRTPSGVDRVDTRTLFSANYLLAQKVNLAYTFTSQTSDDNVAQRSSEQRSHVATATYGDSFFNERLGVNGSYLFNRVDAIERFAPVAAASGGLVLLPVVLAGAFAVTETDPTVAAASKVPPATYTTLATSSGTALGISAPLLINDGGAPNKNQSVAVGLAAGASITTVRVTVSPRAGDTRDISVQAQGVTFQIFAGANPQINQTGWTAVPTLSVTSPTALNPYFEIAFGSTGGTFLKIHVAADSQQPTFPPLTATAIAAFGSATAGAETKNRLTTGNQLQSLTGGIMVRPITALTLNANASFTTNEQDPSGLRNDTGTYSLTATGTPHRLLTATGVYQSSFTSTNAPQTPRTATRLASLTLSSTPLPTLTASLSASRNENDLGDLLQNRTDAVSFNTAVKPYRNLNVDITTTTSQGRNFVDGTKTQAFSGTLNANAMLTPKVIGLFGYTLSDSQVTGGVTPSSVISHAVYLSFTYTISRFLNASARWDYTASEGNYTVTQQYRLDLIPTLKTSIFLNYQRSDQSAAGVTASTDTATLTARWNISQYLDLSATTNITLRNTGDTVYSIFGSLAFRL